MDPWVVGTTVTALFVLIRALSTCGFTPAILAKSLTSLVCCSFLWERVLELEEELAMVSKFGNSTATSSTAALLAADSSCIVLIFLIDPTISATRSGVGVMVF